MVETPELREQTLDQRQLFARVPEPTHATAVRIAARTSFALPCAIA